ncbi:MAG: sigma-70 family RNA polymerase sigma factor [Planctomycetes bacterium]|nr:sigma-70 family RNA polymerase sigma factor [Planctomycetota bacterium]
MSQPVPKPEPPTPEADRLVRMVVGGDTPAFAGLIRLYESDVWRIASTLVRDWEATENLVQQAFIDAYTHLHQYQLGTDFGAWIRTLTRNRLRKELRTLSRAEQRLAVYREQLAERLRAEEPVHDDSDVYLSALRSCREELPEDEAAILRLRYERGLSFEAIATRRGTTAAAVQRAISRIRFRLRACIEGQLKPT